MNDTKTEMVERVARTMHAAKPPEYQWELAGQTVQDAMRKMARAAIEAMREPTEEMVDAGAVAEGDGNLAAEARNIWSAMITAALKE